MHKQIVWTLFFLLMLLLFINSLGGTSGYISPSEKAPPGWRKRLDMFQPSGSFTQSDRDIILKLSNDQISAIASVVAKAVGLPSEGLLVFLHNLISVNELELFANQLIEAPDEKSAIAVFSRYKKLLSPQISMPTMAPPIAIPNTGMPPYPKGSRPEAATSSFMTSIENPVVYKYVPPLADIKQRIVQLDSIQDANEYNKARITLRNDVLSYQGLNVYDTVMNIPGRVTSPFMPSMPSMAPPAAAVATSSFMTTTM